MQEYDPAFVAEILRIDKLPPEKIFKNLEELMEWLNAQNPYAPSY